MHPFESDKRSLPLLRSNLNCEACGAAFICGAASGTCWCAEVKLSEATRAMLATRYTNCLCRACLESYYETEKNNDEKAEQVSSGAAN